MCLCSLGLSSCYVLKHVRMLRLCLVAVKRFPEKENISMCLVAF